MRSILKLIAFLCAFTIIGNGQLANASILAKPASTELPTKLLDMKVSEFIKMSAKDFSTSIGKKLSLKERVAFSLMKKDMKKSLKSQPDQTVKDYITTAPKKDNTALIIIIVVVVIVIVAIIIASSVSIGSIGWGG